MDNWKKYLDKETLSFVNKVIFDSAKYKQSFLKSKRPATTQLLIAIALLYKHIYDLELKIGFLEKALKEISGKKEERGQAKMDFELEKEEMALKEADKIIQELTKGQKARKEPRGKTKKKSKKKNFPKRKK